MPLFEVPFLSNNYLTFNFYLSIPFLITGHSILHQSSVLLLLIWFVGEDSSLIPAKCHVMYLLMTGCLCIHFPRLRAKVTPSVVHTLTLHVASTVHFVNSL